MNDVETLKCTLIYISGVKYFYFEFPNMNSTHRLGIFIHLNNNSICVSRQVSWQYDPE